MFLLSFFSLNLWIYIDFCQISNLELPYFKESNPILEKLAKNYPDYRKNEPHVCSFFLKGECNRGLECPYKHDQNEVNTVSDQNMKDRFHGKNDPLAEKILKKYFATKTKMDNPSDPTIKTLIIPSLGENVSHAELKELFEKYGEIESMNILSKKNLKSAEITYKTRMAAEEAISTLFNKIKINDVSLTVHWKSPPEEKRDLGLRYENDDELLIPPEVTDSKNIANRPRPPLIPPPEIYHDQNKQQKVLLNIVHQSQRPMNNAYPSMNPYAIVFILWTFL